MDKKKWIGIGIFVVLIIAIIVGKILIDKNDGTTKKKYKNLTQIYVATGGGKEDFLADEEVADILASKYGIEVAWDNWSNGKTITQPLIREYVGLGDQSIAQDMKSGYGSYTINSPGVSKYDALFTSDQRFYDYYKLFPKDGEADRYTVLDGGLTLNTPIVIYSWKEVVDALTNQGIVTKAEDGVYYITDMNKLINLILEGKKWSDIGLNELYGTINIASTDPVTSSPGATYYGLLLSILGEGSITDQNLETNLPKLKTFYEKSGYMNNTPADLFERYLKTGMGGEPMIVDYEKSVIDFANANPNGFKQVKDDIVILYPKPTIWNSHCFMAFSENGKKLYDALNDERISQIAWEKYGFRTGITGGNYDVSSLGMAVPSKISNTVTSLKMDYYNRLIEYLSTK